MLAVYEHIDPMLLPTMKKLESLSEQVTKLESTKAPSPAEVTSIQRELDLIEASKVRDTFWGAEGAKDGVPPPAGQAVIQRLVEKYGYTFDLAYAFKIIIYPLSLHDRTRILLLSQERIHESLYPIYEALLAIRYVRERLSHQDSSRNMSDQCIPYLQA